MALLLSTGLMMGFVSSKAMRVRALSHAVIILFSLMSVAAEIWLGTSLATILLSCSLTLGLLIGTAMEFTRGAAGVIRGAVFLAAYPASWYFLFTYGLSELLEDGLLGAKFFRELFDWSFFLIASRVAWFYLFATQVLEISGFHVLQARYLLLGLLLALNLTAAGVVESGYQLASGVPHGFLKVWLLSFPDQVAGTLLICFHSAVLILAGCFVERCYSRQQRIPY